MENSIKNAFPQLAAVIPMYNESGNVEQLLEEVYAALEGVVPDGFEVLVVDDASTDATLSEMQACAKRWPQLRVVQHAQNIGQSGAILTGVRQASAGWIVTLDGDGQNDPADIGALWAAVSPGVCAVGNRKQRQDTWIKRQSSKIANAIRQSMLRDNCPDTGCGLKCFSKAAFMQLPHFDHFHRFLPALFVRAGLKVINVPVGHRPRQHGQSKYGTWDRLRVGVVDILGVIWLSRRHCQATLKKNV